MAAGRGSCGEIVGRASEVEERPVDPSMAEGGVTIRWLVGPGDRFNFYMRLFTMPPGSWIKGHHHPWEHEIFIVEGSGRVRIGETTYHVGKGDFLYIPPNVEHEYWADGEGMKFLCMIPAGPTTEENGKKC